MTKLFLVEGHLFAIQVIFDVSHSFCPGSWAFLKFCLSKTFLREFFKLESECLFFRGNFYHLTQRLKAHKSYLFKGNSAWTCKQLKVFQHSFWRQSSSLCDYRGAYRPTFSMHNLDRVPCRPQE